MQDLRSIVERINSVEEKRIVESFVLWKNTKSKRPFK